jgi:hypothetical protein
VMQPDPARTVRFRRTPGPGLEREQVSWVRELGLSAACEPGGPDELTDECAGCREVDDRFRACGCVCHLWPEVVTLPTPARPYT